MAPPTRPDDLDPQYRSDTTTVARIDLNAHARTFWAKPIWMAMRSTFGTIDATELKVVPLLQAFLFDMQRLRDG